jgi:phosphopantothenoylcysteine decarboxylase/phosphopantothenate--cysteine ligase
MAEPFSGSLAERKVLLCVTGSIAAYKAPMLLRLLKAGGARVKVLLTESAKKFIGEPVFSGLGAEVFTDMWSGPGEPHVELNSWADIIVVAPATADTLARLRQGRADDLLTATALCADKPVVVAPAMHPTMWRHPATQENILVLKDRGVRFIGPANGEVASGETGVGRMEEPEGIAAVLVRLLEPRTKPLTGMHLVVTAGPTREALDPVRSLTNLSSGKMGYAIAQVALDQGAEVTLISGPVNLRVPPGAICVPITSALEMQEALKRALGENMTQADALIMSAAVADFRPKEASEQKVKRGKEDLTLTLTPNPDLLAEIGTRRSGLRPVLVGFALETVEGDELISLGRQKLIKKQVDMVVANSASDSLGKDSAVVRLVSARDCIPLQEMEKAQVAAHVIDWVVARLKEPATSDKTH